ncbi:hypothetical protein ACFTXB_24715 [Streptomyces sp. NPDC057074]|uniref:hypothetical protein n=1 Tax=Streptomyces sp. NPDC057074 TaxID=3346015 RepID=UPI00362C47CB
MTFLEGYDLGSSGALLDGFTEWLLDRKGEDSSFGWRVLVLEEAFPGSSVHWSELNEDQERRAVAQLFILLISFLKDRVGQPGE